MRWQVTAAVLPQAFQNLCLRPRDIAGPKRNDQIARPCRPAIASMPSSMVRSVVRRTVPVGLQLFEQRIRVDAFNRLFRRGINIQQVNIVCLMKGGAKLFQQELGARKTVRLKENENVVGTAPSRAAANVAFTSVG